MLKDVIAAQPLSGHRLRLRFEDGIEGVVDLGQSLSFNGVFQPLKDPAYFAALRVDSELGHCYVAQWRRPRSRCAVRQRNGAADHTGALARPPWQTYGGACASFGCYPGLVRNESSARLADVAKLADAPDLGSGSREGVGVQVPSSAPK